jgi:catechol 2,3-dioxygenase-like lactoylglutathione lyase family enzyme
VDEPRFGQLVTFLRVSSLEATAAFYGGVLGLEQVLDQGACRIFRAAGDAFVGFCRPTTNLVGEPATGVILTLVVDGRTAVDAWAERLSALDADALHGGRIDRPPAYNPAFNIYHLFLRDPDGYLVEIQAFLDPVWPAPVAGRQQP